MNYFLLIIALVFTLFAASCSKTRDCVCSYTNVKGETVTLEASPIKGTKKASKKACEDNDDEWSGLNGSCVLK